MPEEWEQTCNFEQVVHTILQSAQLQFRITSASNFECFDQRGNSGAVDVWDIDQVDRQRLQLAVVQRRKQSIAKTWGGLDRKTAIQRHDSAVLVVAHRNL